MKKIRKFLKSKTIEKLWAAIAALDGPQEVRLFIQDLLTPSEVSMAGMRLLIATLFRKGMTYEQIVAQTGASKSTVHRVWNILHRGSGGYELAFSALSQQWTKKEYERRQWSKSPQQRMIEARLRRGK